MVRWMEVRISVLSFFTLPLTLALSIVGFFAALLFVPETKALSLEELDQGTYYPVRVPFVSRLLSRSPRTGSL